MFHRRKSLSTIMDMKSGKPRSRLWFWCFLCCSLWVVLLFVHFRVLGRDKSVEVVEAVEDSIRKFNNHVPSIKKPAPSSYLLSPPSNSKKMVPPKPPNSEIVGSSNTMMVSPKPSDSKLVSRNTKVVSPRTSKSKMVSENYDDLSPPAFMRAMRSAENKSDPCGGKYVYVHKLPPSYNVEMLKECRSLSLWTNMCKFTSNAGLGPPLDNSEGVFSHTGWFATNQFAVDVIFFNRMKQYECLTNDSSLASVVYVPFYAGLDISRHLWGYNISVRDAASLELMDWLVKQPEWKINNGHDHFLVGGRITWDFRRLSDEETDWGSKLLFLPAMKNMTMLVVEASPWNRNDMAIPYPTYFHPAKDSDIVEWQQRMHSMDRPYLFSFAGAPRPDMPKSIRGQIIEQCRNSKLGMLLECDFGESKCHSPSSIMNMFQHSAFCLQPQGDSYTRRSFFDSILAGCIPVTFHPGSAYAQYIWHLPKDYTTYSVFIPEDDIRKGNISIEQRLLQISPEKVRSMREEVIKLIPSLVYADPRSKLKNYKDAFDIAVESMIEKVTKLRNEILEGKEVEDYKEDVDGSEQGTRKWEGLRREGERTWDEFFSKPKNEMASSSP